MGQIPACLLTGVSLKAYPGFNDNGYELQPILSTEYCTWYFLLSTTFSDLRPPSDGWKFIIVEKACKDCTTHRPGTELDSNKLPRKQGDRSRYPPLLWSMARFALPPHEPFQHLEYLGNYFSPPPAILTWTQLNHSENQRIQTHLSPR